MTEERLRKIEERCKPYLGSEFRELIQALRGERERVKELEGALDKMLWAHTDSTFTPVQREANKVARELLPVQPWEGGGG